MEKHKTLERFIHQYLTHLENANIKNANEYFSIWLDILKNLSRKYAIHFEEPKLDPNIEYFQHVLTFEDINIYFVFLVEYLIEKSTNFPAKNMPLTDFYLEPSEYGQIQYSIPEHYGKDPDKEYKTTPIIYGTSGLFLPSMFCVLDGNSRLQNAKEKNWDSIKAVFVDEKILVNSMCTEFEQCLFLFVYELAQVHKRYHNKKIPLQKTFAKTIYSKYL